MADNPPIGVTPPPVADRAATARCLREAGIAALSAPSGELIVSSASAPGAILEFA